MQMVLFILVHCEEKQLTPQISARGGLYGDPQGRVDWFSALFESVRPSSAATLPRRVRTSVVRALEQLGFWRRYEAGLRLQSASELFRSYYRPVAAVRDEVASACARLNICEITLSVHFRGTDKKFEAEPLSWIDFCRLVVEQTLALNPHLTNLFVSSDEQAFIDFFRAWPFNHPIGCGARKAAIQRRVGGALQRLPGTGNRARGASVESTAFTLRTSRENAVLPVGVVENLQSRLARYPGRAAAARCVLVSRQPDLARARACHGR